MMTPCSFGDLARIAVTLNLSPESAEDLTLLKQMLGLGGLKVQSQSSRKVTEPYRTSRNRQETHNQASKQPANDSSKLQLPLKADSLDHMVPKNPQQLRALPATLNHFQKDPIGPPIWLGPEPLDNSASRSDVSTAQIFNSFTPLFKQERSRTLLAELCSRLVDSGKMNIQTTIDLIAQGKAISRPLPLFCRRLFSKVYVLLDVSPSMQPFARDRQILIRQLLRLLGESRVAFFEFSGSPCSGVRPAGANGLIRFEWLDAGALILLVSHLGITSNPFVTTAAPIEWIDFGYAAKKCRCPVTILNPYPEQRWPSYSKLIGEAVHWDVASTVNSIRIANRHWQFKNR